MFDEHPKDTFHAGPTQPLPLQFIIDSSEAVPEGAVLLETRLRGHTIVRGLAGAGGGQALAQQEEVLVPLLLEAEEYEGGIRGRVLALFRISEDEAREMRGSAGEEGAGEPWKASVPSFGDEPEMEGREGAVPMAAVLLGDVIREAANRQHPDDPQAETESLLEAVLSAAGRDADRAAIDSLLDSI